MIMIITIMQSTPNIPAIVAESLNMAGRRRSRNVFREEEVIGASVNDALDPGSTSENEGILATDVGDNVDAQGDPEAAERKRRRATVPENSTGAAETGMDASRAVPKKRANHLYPPGGVGGVGDVDGEVGRPLARGNKSASDSVDMVGSPPSVAGNKAVVSGIVGRPLARGNKFIWDSVGGVVGRSLARGNKSIDVWKLLLSNMGTENATCKTRLIIFTLRLL
jgi:hypothetical protein